MIRRWRGATRSSSPCSGRARRWGTPRSSPRSSADPRCRPASTGGSSTWRRAATCWPKGWSTTRRRCCSPRRPWSRTTAACGSTRTRRRSLGALGAPRRGGDRSRGAPRAARHWPRRSANGGPDRGPAALGVHGQRGQHGHGAGGVPAERPRAPGGAGGGTGRGVPGADRSVLPGLGGAGERGAAADRAGGLRIPTGRGAGGRLASGVPLCPAQRAPGRRRLGPHAPRHDRGARGRRAPAPEPDGMSPGGLRAVALLALATLVVGCAKDAPVGRHIGVWCLADEAVAANEQPIGAASAPSEKGRRIREAISRAIAELSFVEFTPDDIIVQIIIGQRAVPYRVKSVVGDDMVLEVTDGGTTKVLRLTMQGDDSMVTDMAKGPANQVRLQRMYTTLR